MSRTGITVLKLGIVYRVFGSTLRLVRSAECSHSKHPTHYGTLALDAKALYLPKAVLVLDNATSAVAGRYRIISYCISVARPGRDAEG